MGTNRSIDTENILEELGKRADGGVDAVSLEPSFIESLSTRELCEVGELCAISYLADRGYEILDHHYRCPAGEADIVAYDMTEDQIVMIEVKTRRSAVNPDGVYPEEAVDHKKRERYKQIASFYCRDKYPVYSIRFDVVGITVKSGCLAQIEHIFDAFDWEME